LADSLNRRVQVYHYWDCRSQARGSAVRKTLWICAAMLLASTMTRGQQITGDVLARMI